MSEVRFILLICFSLSSYKAIICNILFGHFFNLFHLFPIFCVPFFFHTRFENQENWTKLMSKHKRFSSEKWSRLQFCSCHLYHFISFLMINRYFPSHKTQKFCLILKSDKRNFISVVNNKKSKVRGCTLMRSRFTNKNIFID